MTNALPYDRRLVRKPFICIQNLNFRPDNFVCEVISNPTDDGPLEFRDIAHGMRGQILPSGKIVLHDPGTLDGERLAYIENETFGLVWQGDIPSSLIKDIHAVINFIFVSEGGVHSGTIGTLDDLTVNVSRHLLSGMAAQLEAALPAIEAQATGLDLGHQAAIRTMIAQAREIAGS